MSDRLVLLNSNYSNHNYEKGSIPPNEQNILDFIQQQKKDEDEVGDTTFVLIDTIWKEQSKDDKTDTDEIVWQDRFGEYDPVTGENKKLARHLGTRAAFYVAIDDKKHENHPWKQHIGITVATDHEVAHVEQMRLGQRDAEWVASDHKDTARSALAVDLKIGSEFMRLAALYLSDTDAQAQWDHIVDLDKKLNGDNPIRKPSGYQAVAMDANGLNRHESYTKPLPRVGSAIIHSLAKAVNALKNPSDRGYYEQLFVTLDTRRVVPHMRTLGYRNVDAGPTWPDAVPVLDPDGIHTFGLKKKSAHTVKGLSDHRAIVYDFDLH